MAELAARRHGDVQFWAESVEHSFQPIVSAKTLKVHGFEALGRLPADAPFRSIIDLLDTADEAGQLRSCERTLLTGAISKFARFEHAAEARLFCNIDNRVVDYKDTSPQAIVDHVRKVGLRPANLCLELSERTAPESEERLAEIVDYYLRHNVRIAIDDFGRGFSGLETLLLVNPHYLKLDQAFVTGIDRNRRARAIAQHMIRMAHSLGLLVVGEGVETEKELQILQEFGCDFVQGFLIARPSSDPRDLKRLYGERKEKSRSESGIMPRIKGLIEKVEPLRIDSPLSDAVERVKKEGSEAFIPVIDANLYVHGAIYYDDLRPYLFGDFGKALLENRGIDHSLEPVLRRCEVSEATSTIDALVDSYLVASSNKGVVVTLDGEYLGVLDNQAMLQLASDRAVETARDQNPLTHLPGNGSITKYVERQLKSDAPITLCFFDFDNFKAFNDKYGFAVGDRAILMFADLLKKSANEQDAFAGHVGGDDFFAAMPSAIDAAESRLRDLQSSFSHNIESLYRPEDRRQGGIWSHDRFGEDRFFPLLKASMVLLEIPAARGHLTCQQVLTVLAEGKKAAKEAEAGVVRVALPPTGVHASRGDLEHRLSGNSDGPTGGPDRETGS
ncbi:GGDEF domain-containing protein [Parasphingopyxis sp.]|uniref:GGDEF domain-containing protein n=1 Tax=Parasphingopyxis sp. TaxID=1920299 RepID=UPI00260E1C79|nr:GGDEF domain-containing protein [Parasphingopyxis sp.]